MAVISSMVGTTVLNFIDYALVIVVIMIVWYALKFFMVKPPSKEDREAALQEQREAWGGAINKVKESHEAKRRDQENKEYKQGLKNQSRPVIGNLKDAFREEVEKALRALDRQEPAAAITAVKRFDGKLHDAWGNLRLLKGKAKGEDKGKVQNIIVQVEAARHVLADKVKERIPRRVEGDWDTKVGPIRAELASLRGTSAAIFNNIDALVD